MVVVKAMERCTRGITHTVEAWEPQKPISVPNKSPYYKEASHGPVSGWVVIG